MSRSALDKYRDQCLETIRALCPMGYWLLPLVPFNAKMGGTYLAPDGSTRKVQKENDPGKCPILPNWQKTRLSEAELIEIFSFEPAYKNKQPYNLGVACGPEKGLITLDIDFKNGGGEFLERYNADLEEIGGLFEHTGNGVHIHFTPPTWAKVVPNIASGTFYKDGRIWKGVELKSDGTQVVTHPSIHPTARRADKKMQQYRFEHDCGLESRGVEMLEFAEPFFGEPLSRKRAFENKNGHPKKKPRKKSDFHNDERDLERFASSISSKKAEAGERNSVSYTIACRARDHSISPDVCRDAMLVWNESNCSPPLETKEIIDIIAHAYHYSKGDAGANSLAAMFEDSEAYKNIEVPKEEVAELEKDTGDLPVKNPSVCAIRLMKKDPRIYYIGENWFAYSIAENSWERIDKEDYEDGVALSLEERCPEDVNLKRNHTKEVYAALRAKVKRKTKLEAPRLREWLRGGEVNHNDVVRVENGIVDLRTGTLLPHSSHWFSTTKLPFEFAAEAECPQFLEFLESLWGHEDDAPDTEPIQNQAQQLQRFMGYLLSSDMSYHKYGLFIGVSRAGKGVLERIVRQLMGDDNTHSTTLDDLGEKHGTMSLPGKQLCLISDAEDLNTPDSKRALQRIKSMTGGDSIPVNPKYGKPYHFQNTAKILMTVNEFPRFIDPASALYNRTMLFSFTKTFANREDRTLDSRLATELPGIFNWALEGYQAWRADGVLANCPQVTPLVTDMRLAMNPIAGFIAAAIEIWKPPEKEQYDKMEGPWDYETPPADFSESKQDLLEAFESCQQQDNRKNWISNRKFFISLKRELCAAGWRESWGEFQPRGYGKTRARRILGVRISTEFKEATRFGQNIDIDDFTGGN